MNYAGTTTKVAEELTPLPDVIRQRQILHDNAWMLKDALDGLQGKLFPVIDARPDDPSAEVPTTREEWHCEFAGLLKEDADMIRACLTQVRSLTTRLQI